MVRLWKTVNVRPGNLNLDVDLLGFLSKRIVTVKVALSEDSLVFCGGSGLII